jgi:molybdenum ABC transporter molybdate-binding protein
LQPPSVNRLLGSLWAGHTLYPAVYPEDLRAEARDFYRRFYRIELAALEKLGVWNTVQRAVAPAESVRAALLFVSRREAPLGIVHATDAAADRRVKIVGLFPEDTHPPIVYPAALTADSKNPSAVRLLDFLGSPAAKQIFEKEGFTVLVPG